MVTLTDVTKTFGAERAADNVSLHVPEGQTTVLIGPSGCGKSTLLRLIIGLIRPDSGTIRVDGTTLSDANLRTLRHRMGYVIQEGGLFPHRTARGNVTLLAKHLRWSTTRIRDRIEALLELVQLPADRLDVPPPQLSGGQRQRVSLMRALMLDPPLLLLDEPLGALDPLIRADLQTDLRRIFRTLGKTVVLVTHDLHEAAYFGDQIVLLRSGQVAQQGPFRELRDAPASDFVREFVQAQQSLTTALDT
ncbi:ABC transporter ATP-binding protein [Longimonas halophila]|uniref:ABC transporter ATP-binding protein n=1 Tax=Longimonas halophila TaxID=1469170 RepID=A0A2H3NZ49_9BACT|nr:ATP-binding cassette domain-containing protein [Longimonas halophila]PEN08293.1 ABC transporter ATP-binding protein [Longimonas halophila]